MDGNELIQAIQTLNSEDTFRPRLDAQQWRTFVQYLTQHELRSGDLLIKQADRDRTIYFLGQGSMQVYVTGGAPGSSRIAILRPGAICGEPGIFGDGPRMANVEAMTPCTVFALRLPRFEELVARVPNVAVEVLRAAGSVMAVRMRANLSRQVPMA
ncbi:cyclic nucleotide-binding domain-containing protein [Aquabacterium sp.]|jgi:CRP/FNR family cyclic AMP-dependent transcriptional regulator|uniref:cyclic nucleotide-binding domain-containing protein n=1 Tax=Aquabacterium sp. TaxID=1872578 RepID=UPI0025C3E05D|nr:cyclic nucleotide-binding domain-containing protein [Aquabacterium sp.]